MARKPSAVARELLRNFPKPGGKRRRKRGKPEGGSGGKDAPARERLEAEEKVEDVVEADIAVEDAGNGPG